MINALTFNDRSGIEPSYGIAIGKKVGEHGREARMILRIFMN